MQPDRDGRLRDAIRAAVKDALDAGMLGRAIISRMDGETAKLRESLPPEGCCDARSE